ncbi:MAG: proline--tRNA ligase, partial [Acidobacteria bacterium]|nr:proline--tRNA ligase [Acidobacteriota bacterium]
LMRGREFIMMDAYSFDADQAGLDVSYQRMDRAYRAIFDRCGVKYTVVDADAGAIGGAGSQEFMVVADTGEDAILFCKESGYAANVEKATTDPLPQPPAEDPAALEEVATPGATAVSDVAALLGVPPLRVVKTLIYDTDQGLVAVAIRGDREVNDLKLTALLGAEMVALASEEKVREATGAPVGFAGPVGLPEGIKLIADESVRGLTNFVCGANKADAHLVGVNWGRDAEPARWADVRLARGGDPGPGGGVLEQFRGIEVGHIFKLGTKYSEPMGCTFLDDGGTKHPMIMGCYGLGIGRTVAAAIEQNHDEDGIIWPLPLAPFEVLLIALNPNDEEVVRQADTLYDEMRAQGLEVLYDDRRDRPGVKFKDADLIGVPVRLVVGAKSLAEGQVEVSLRRDRERQMVALADAVDRVATLVRG